VHVLLGPSWATPTEDRLTLFEASPAALLAGYSLDDPQKLFLLRHAGSFPVWIGKTCHPVPFAPVRNAVLLTMRFKLIAAGQFSKQMKTASFFTFTS
jgi:hypothetical protein